MCCRLSSYKIKILLVLIALYICIMITLLSVKTYHLMPQNWTYCDHLISDARDDTNLCFDILSDNFNISVIPQECQQRCHNYRLLSTISYISIILTLIGLLKGFMAMISYKCRDYNRIQDQLMNGNLNSDISNQY